ncbi:SusD/RagB family nutrient-binding outer membrane lipoprotein [Longimicrobium sp.]|jgi:hypothetical protein|uniref:SusD/RagB family nutrient-binding outer membrane lipoprotein n=1 Tax=Longimicrobium sp. TaxID=2029185 RepID=UPI002ED9BCD3
MKNSILVRLAPMLALTLGAAACDGLTDLNEDPNAPTEVPARFLLTDGQQDAADRLLGTSFNIDYSSVLVQHLAQIQYAEEDLYLYRSADTDLLFREAYSGYLMDFHTVARLGEAEGEPNVQAAGLIMKSWGMQNLTDMWGDLPYSEAFGGIEGGVITPKYDTQAQIYDKMLADVTAAAAMIKTGDNPLGAQDLIYGGNGAKWQKFANSLRLRMAMRMADANPTKARTEFVAALAGPGGVFTSSADNAQICYTSTTRNPWFTYWQSRPGDYRVGRVLVDTLKSLSDPRLSAFAQPITATKTYGGRTLAAGEMYYEGLPAGLAANNYGFTQVSQPGAALLAQTACLPVLTYEEVLFLRAEAAARGFTADNAQAMYQAAVTASMVRWGGTEAEAQAYLAQPRVMWNAANWRPLIGLQKWIALYGQGLEAYAEVRRLDNPVLRPGPDAVLQNSIPARYPYPFSEETFNATNLQEAMTRQGITGASTAQTAKVWWDKS